MPVNQARTGVMPQAGQIDFRVPDLTPNLKHVPQADVVEDQQRVFPYAEGFEVRQQASLENPVLGSVNEDQLRRAKQIGAIFDGLSRAEIADNLRQSSRSEIRVAQEGPLDGVPPLDINRRQRRPGGQRGQHGQGAQAPVRGSRKVNRRRQRVCG